MELRVRKRPNTDAFLADVSQQYEELPAS